MKKKTRTKEDLRREAESLQSRVKQPEAVDKRRKRAEDALKEAEQRFRALTDTSLQGLVIVQGMPLRVVYASAPVAEITGYSTDELMSFTPDKIQKILYGNDQERIWRNYQGRLD